MGGRHASLISAESPNWTSEHSLKIDAEMQRKQSSHLSGLKKDLHLCSATKDIHGVQYQHYWITDYKYVIEFGDGTLTEGTARAISAKSPKPESDKPFTLSKEVEDRMMSVLGATNYSLCLRNSEHFARYIMTGTWYSLQMTAQAPLFVACKDKMGEHKSRINTPPVELATKSLATASASPIYESFKSSRRLKFLRHSAVVPPGDNEFNILVLGPTGAGKSTIINLLFNQRVADVKASALSVTKQMEVYTGTYTCPSYPQGQGKKMNVIDSVGFCDSVMPPMEVLDLVKTYVKSSVVYLNKVVIVCAGRIEFDQAQAMKNMMEWLGYSNHKAEFVFVYNKAENLDETEKLVCLGQMCSTLNADSTFSTWERDSAERVDYALALGFPPRAPLSAVHDDLIALYKAVFLLSPLKQRLKVPVGETACPIL